MAITFSVTGFVFCNTVKSSSPSKRSFSVSAKKYATLLQVVLHISLVVTVVLVFRFKLPLVLHPNLRVGSYKLKNKLGILQVTEYFC